MADWGQEPLGLDACLSLPKWDATGRSRAANREADSTKGLSVPLDVDAGPLLNLSCSLASQPRQLTGTLRLVVPADEEAWDRAATDKDCLGTLEVGSEPGIQRLQPRESANAIRGEHSVQQIMEGSHRSAKGLKGSRVPFFRRPLVLN